MRVDEHPLYDSWAQIRQRCLNPAHPAYKYYGGRGIKLCRRWQNNFWCFVKDVGPRPKGRSLDRRDNAGHYSPSNFRWATPKQQSQNSRRPRFIRYSGVRLCISDWAKRLGITQSTLSHRIHRQGAYAAIKSGGKGGPRRLITQNGVTLGVTDWIAKLGISSAAFYERVRNHGIKEAIRMGGNKLSKGESLARKIKRK